MELRSRLGVSEINRSQAQLLRGYAVAWQRQGNRPRQLPERLAGINRPSIEVGSSSTCVVCVYAMLSDDSAWPFQCGGSPIGVEAGKGCVLILAVLLALGSRALNP
jgi:hypothetical protein